MKKQTTTDWTPAYQEAYEIAKKGNPVIQAAIARACFDSDTNCIGTEDAYHLIKEAAKAGFPPALLLQSLYAVFHLAGEDESNVIENSMYKAALMGNAEATCINAISQFYQSKINEAELLGVLADNRCVTAIASLIIERFVNEAEEAEGSIRQKVAKIEELACQANSCRTQHQAQVHKRNTLIGELEARVASLTKTIASLSASAMAREMESLRSELATAKHDLANAATQIAEADILLETKVSDAVGEIELQLVDAQVDWGVAVEERDNAIKKADKSDRRAKHLEQLLFKHGINPMNAFADEEATASQVPVSDHV